MKARKRKFVVWLHNHTDSRDDEWVVVWAKTRKETEKASISIDDTRFSRGSVYTALEFRERMGVAG